MRGEPIRQNPATGGPTVDRPLESPTGAEISSGESSDERSLATGRLTRLVHLATNTRISTGVRRAPASVFITEVRMQIRDSVRGAACLVTLALTAAVSAAPPVIFVSRQLDTTRDRFEIVIGQERPDPEPRSTAVTRATSGRLMLREENGSLVTLLDATAEDAPDWAPVDVMEPDVSYDASRVVFAGFSATENAWRIYEMLLDTREIRQLTHSDRDIDLSVYGDASNSFETYDDVDPCYLPDGRICFVSTRYPGTAPDNRLRATNLYVMHDDGSDLHRITTERFGADTPAVDPTNGQIVYSRWWRTNDDLIGAAGADAGVDAGSPGYDGASSGDLLGISNSNPEPMRSVSDDEFQGLNSWFLAGVDPDGTDLAMTSGLRLDRELTQAYRPSFLPNGEILATFIPRTPYLGLPRGDGLRIYDRGPGQPEAVGGPQTFQGFPFLFGLAIELIHIADPEFRFPDNRDSWSFIFASGVGLPDGTILTAAAPMSAHRYDLFVVDRATGKMTLFAGTDGADLDPVLVVERPEPPEPEEKTPAALPQTAAQTVSGAFTAGGRFTFNVTNIHFNAPIDVPVATAPPVGQDLTIEFYMAPQGTTTQFLDEAKLIRAVKIPSDGHVEVELPAGVPLFEVLRRPDGSIAQGRDGQVFHVGGMNFNRAGEAGKCVGCHAGHTMMQVPEDPTWTNLAPSANVSADPSSFYSVFEVVPEVDLFFGEDILAGDEPNLFGPEKLVDRRTRRMTEWVGADTDAKEHVVTLEWPVAINAQQIAVYSPAQGQGVFGRRSQTISGLSVETYLGESLVERLATEDVLDSTSRVVRVQADPTRAIDRVRVILAAEDISGSFEFARSPGLAEIEVIAKVASATSEVYTFIRGDSNCDSSTNISDAISTLTSLFVDGKELCCDAAGDTDANGRLNIADPVYLLNYLFADGEAPPAPTGECGEVAVQNLGCNEQSCVQ